MEVTSEGSPGVLEIIEEAWNSSAASGRPGVSALDLTPVVEYWDGAEPLSVALAASAPILDDDVRLSAASISII